MLRFLPIAAVLAGCAAEPAPEPQAVSNEPKTPCEEMVGVIQDPWTTPGDALIAMEIARNMGCFGQPQPQTVIVQ